MKADVTSCHVTDPLIAFRGAILGARPDGRAEIELPNGHRIIAAASSTGFRPAPGDQVRVELPYDQVTGWRFRRHP